MEDVLNYGMFKVTTPDLTFANSVVVLSLAVENIPVNADAIACPTTRKFHARKWFKEFANVAIR